METYRLLGQPNGLPDEDDYLIGDFWAVGPSRLLGGGGEAPIGDQEIFYFSRLNGIDVDRFDRDALIEMSRGYCQAKIAGEKPGALPPVEQTGDPETDRGRAIMSALRRAAPTKKKEGGKP